MNLRGRALVVDDQLVWLELFEELLLELGLEVVPANNYEDAINLLNSQYFHLAVVDVRLQDDDAKNTQGLEILSHINEIGLGDVVAKIVITGYGTRDWARESFKAHKAHDFIPKQGPEGKGFDDEDFVQSVETAFSDKLKINFDLEIEFIHGLTLDELASRAMRDDNGKESLEAIRWELDDLMRKLFPDARSLTVSRVSGGHSRTSVIRVEPFYERQGQAGALIIKYGRVSEIEREASNFARYVRRFTSERRHTSLECKARTRLLGGIGYSLIGAPFEKVRSLNDFYSQSEANGVCLVLDDLFDQNCRRWYENRSKKRTRNLAHLYWEPAGTTHEKLLRCFQQMYPRFVDRPRITFPQVDGEFVNPVYHSFVRDKPIYLPVYTAITHGDLNGENVFVDQDNHTWMIDFSQTGDGHISRDFVTLESVIKFQLLEEESLRALYEFEKAILSPDSLTDSLRLPQIPMSTQMAKAFTVIEHLRELAGTVIQPSKEMHAYYAGLFYHTLNLIRYYHLLRLKRRKHYILLSAAMLCEKLGKLATTR